MHSPSLQYLRNTFAIPFQYLCNAVVLPRVAFFSVRFLLFFLWQCIQRPIFRAVTHRFQNSDGGWLFHFYPNLHEFRFPERFWLFFAGANWALRLETSNLPSPHLSNAYFAVCVLIRVAMPRFAVLRVASIGVASVGVALRRVALLF